MINLLEFRFPLDFNHTCKLVSDKNNHALAIDYPNDITTSFEEDMSYKVIIGPVHKEHISVSFFYLS